MTLDWPAMSQLLLIALITPVRVTFEQLVSHFGVGHFKLPFGLPSILTLLHDAHLSYLLSINEGPSKGTFWFEHMFALCSLLPRNTTVRRVWAHPKLVELQEKVYLAIVDSYNWDQMALLFVLLSSSSKQTCEIDYLRYDGLYIVCFCLVFVMTEQPNQHDLSLFLINLLCRTQLALQTN